MPGKHNWRRELIYLGLIGMETSWVAAALGAFARTATGFSLGKIALFVGFLLLLSTSLARALGRLRVVPSFHWAVMTVSLLLTLGLVFGLHLYPAAGPDRPPGLIVMLVLGLIVFIWWRGNSLAQTNVASPNVVSMYFWLGLSVLILLIILGHFLPGQAVLSPPVEGRRAIEQIISFIPAYFFLSLITTGVARIEEIVCLPESTAASPPTGYWLALLISSVGGVVLVSLLLSAFFAGGGLARSLSWIPPLLRKSGHVLYQILDVLATAIATALAYLVSPVLEWWTALELPGLIEKMLSPIVEGLEQLQRMLEQEAATRDSGDGWLIVGRSIVIALLILAVLSAGRAARRRREGAKTLVDDLPADLLAAWKIEGTAGSLRDGLGEWKNRFRQGLYFLHALSIRRIYANLVRLATHMGHPRRPDQTPYEYQKVLERALPAHKANVRTITQAYVHAHYGRVPDSRKELKRIREAWRRIRDTA